MPPEASAVRARRLGRLSALERAEALCDPGTFVREGAELRGRHPDAPPGDGLVYGSGAMGGRPVAVLANDVTVLRGALGASAGRAAAAHVHAAVDRGAPVVWLVDSDGARVQEGLAAVEASTRLLAALAHASGRVPLLAGLCGLAGGVAAYGLSLCDWACAVEDRSFLFVAGPAVIKSAIGEDVPLDELGGTRAQLAAGTLSAVAPDDGGVLAWLRAMVAVLPAASWQAPPVVAGTAPAQSGPLPLPPPRKAYAAFDILAHVVDAGSLMPLSPGFGGSVQVGLARLDGRPVGMIASHPRVLGGAIDADAAQKLARFVRFCAGFHLPLVTFCDTPGFLPGKRQEQARVLVHGAKVISAYTEARAAVPVISVVLRRAVGAGAVLAFSAEPVLALADVELQQMGPAAAASAYDFSARESDDAQALGLVHRTIAPELVRHELVAELARAPVPVLCAPGGRRAALLPL